MVRTICPVVDIPVPPGVTVTIPDSMLLYTLYASAHVPVDPIPVQATLVGGMNAISALAPWLITNKPDPDDP